MLKNKINSFRHMYKINLNFLWFILKMKYTIFKFALN